MSVKYSQNTTQILIFIKVYYLNWFFQRHVSTVIMSHFEANYFS